MSDSHGVFALGPSRRLVVTFRASDAVPGFNGIDGIFVFTVKLVGLLLLKLRTLLKADCPQGDELQTNYG